MTFVAVVFADAVEATARFFSKGFRLGAWGRRLMVGAMAGTAVFFWVGDQIDLRRDIGKDPMTTLGWETWDLIVQLRASDFRPRPGSLLVFSEDPFTTLDMYFLGRLWVHDRSVTVRTSGQRPLEPAELAKADHIFAFRNRRLIRLK